MLKIIQNSRHWVSQRLNIVANLTAENLALRQQLIVLKRNQNRAKMKDRDRLFWVVLSRIWSGWQNAYVERLNGSIRRECLDHVIVWNERHLSRILKAYFAYYNEDRTHLGLDKETPEGRPISKRPSPNARLVELPRVGGLHHRYEWSFAA